MDFRAALLFPFVVGSVALAARVPSAPNTMDPKHDPFNPLKYIASDVLTAIAFSQCPQFVVWRFLTSRVSLGLVILVALVQTWWIKKWGARWMLSMTIGAYSKFTLSMSTFSLLYTNILPCQHLLSDLRCASGSMSCQIPKDYILSSICSWCSHLAHSLPPTMSFWGVSHGTLIAPSTLQCLPVASQLYSFRPT